MNFAVNSSGATMELIDLDAQIEIMRESCRIRCPYCLDIVYDPNDSNDELPADELITYWGEEGPVRITCHNCSLDFMVEECVQRTFECEKIEGEHDDSA